MSNNRLLLLIVISLALGALVWLDSRPSGTPEGASRAAQPRETAAARGSEVQEASGEGESAEAETNGQLQTGNPLASFDKARLKDTVGRPLFASSRKRPDEVVERAANKQGPAKPPPSYDLLGVVSDGGRAIALMRQNGDGKSFRVEVGDMIGGWRVSKVEPKAVLLEREDGTAQTVPLYRE